MKKRSKLKIAKDKAWKVFSLYIRTKYADENGMVECVTCGDVKPIKEMQAGHFLAGRGNAILFDPRGVHPQCYSCNVCKHGNIEEYYPFMLENYGQEVIDDLKRLKNGESPKRTVEHYEALRFKYEKLIGEFDL